MNVLPFSAISAADRLTVGGKGANLGEMSGAGFPVPPGFCVTTAAFNIFLAQTDMQPWYARLDALDGNDVSEARAVASDLRALLDRLAIPKDVALAVTAAWEKIGKDGAYAVRSSATAEDLPDASFAGQHDTYLNIRGAGAVLDAVRRCWISLFTDRAVLYRARNRFGHRDVKLSVVVQRMVLPQVSGIMFTADPINGRRKTVSVEAGFGLGEALVSGLVNADLYRVDKDSRALLETHIGDKALAIRPLPEGGTREEELSDDLRKARVLDDPTLQALVELGLRIEKHYAKPQDIEWCIEERVLYVVQARPITSLYPLPDAASDEARIYVSFGHVQMMTDPMPPLAIQVWRRLLPVQRVGGESTVVKSAGSRIFLDLTPLLRQPIFRRGLIGLFGRVYPVIAEGLKFLTRKPAFVRDSRLSRARVRTLLAFVAPVVARTLWLLLLARDPQRERRRLNDFGEAWIADGRMRLLAATPGVARLEFAQRVLAETFRGAFLTLAAHIPSGLAANALLHLMLRKRASSEDLVAIERGLPGSVTTEMDLAVGDLTDILRAHPEIMPLVRTNPGSLTEPQFAAAWRAFMARFGMRGPGEVDISRPRYKDDPQVIVSALLGGLREGRPPRAHRAKHEALAVAAELASERLVQAARYGLFGGLRARWVKRLIGVARNGLAEREHPKFLLVRVFDLVREAIGEAAEMLVQKGLLAAAKDVYLFGFEEIVAALQVPRDLRTEAAARAEILRRDVTTRPPFMMASDGEVPPITLREGLPEGALSGTPASSGVVEGVAHVVRDPAKEVLEAGEILVAPHTDPGWTPLFVHAAGLVTEVGGLITHGSVVAREYGIPAVVSVADATTRIRTGQRIRVDGSRGIVEILDP